MRPVVVDGAFVCRGEAAEVDVGAVDIKGRGGRGGGRWGEGGRRREGCRAADVAARRVRCRSGWLLARGGGLAGRDVDAGGPARRGLDAGKAVLDRVDVESARANSIQNGLACIQATSGRTTGIEIGRAHV